MKCVFGISQLQIKTDFKRLKEKKERVSYSIRKIVFVFPSISFASVWPCVQVSVGQG